MAKLRSNHSAMAGWNKCDGFTLAGSPGEIESWWPAQRSGNRARLIVMIW
jgi:hypothetical protein